MYTAWKLPIIAFISLLFYKIICGEAFGERLTVTAAILMTTSLLFVIAGMAASMRLAMLKFVTTPPAPDKASIPVETIAPFVLGAAAQAALSYAIIWGFSERFTDRLYDEEVYLFLAISSAPAVLWYVFEIIEAVKLRRITHTDDA